VYIEPDYSTLTKMKERRDAGVHQVRNLERLKGKENVTQSGQKIDIFANVGTREDIENVLRSDAGGIGLFRSEFLYMETGNRIPTEDQIFQVYRLAAESMGNNRVVIRVADLGGDKMAQCIDLGRQENPAIGFRGLRVMFEKEELFLEQLRAILRASVFGHIRIMFPMMISLKELAQAKAITEECKEELRREGIPFDENIETGMMMETPASVLLAEEFAKEADFFSIGTNDLTQYILAVDRGNKKIASRYDSFHPAVLKAIEMIIQAGHKYNRKVGMCGELAGDVNAVHKLLQLGLDEFSMSAGNVDYVRKAVIDEAQR